MVHYPDFDHTNIAASPPAVKMNNIYVADYFYCTFICMYMHCVTNQTCLCIMDAYNAAQSTWTLQFDTAEKTLRM